MKAVIFSGGSGAATIIKAFATDPSTELTVLVNCYDDGKSTGRLRQLYPGMLGPSDVRKVVGHITGESSYLEWRFPEFKDIFVDWNYGNRFPAPSFFKGYFDVASKHSWSWTDMAAGNVLFAGIYEACDKDFNHAVGVFCGLVKHVSKTHNNQWHVLNITDGTDLFLVAKCKEHSWYWSEAAICDGGYGFPIEDLYLIPRDYFGIVHNADTIARAAVVPQPNPEAIEALRNADVILYGPGTMHSSIFPSFMTDGVGYTIASNTKAAKIWVPPFQPDRDTEFETFASLEAKMYKYLGREMHTDVVTDVLWDGQGFIKWHYAEPIKHDGNKVLAYAKSAIGTK